MNGPDEQMTPGISPAERLRPAPQVRFRELRGEGILLDLERGLYFRLNETGVAIWSGLEAGLSLGEIDLRLQSEFEVDPDQAWRELKAIVRAMKAERLLVVDPG